MTHQFDTSDYIIVPDDHPRLMDKESIEAVKREAYNQAIEDAARLCSKFDENNGEALCVSYQLELKVKELKK